MHLLRIVAVLCALIAVSASPALAADPPTLLPATAQTNIAPSTNTELVTDDDNNSRWISNDPSGSAGDWFRLDLGSAKWVGRVELRQSQGDADGFQGRPIPSDAVLEWSADGTSWTQIPFSGSDWTQADVTLDTPVRARYVRVKQITAPLNRWQIRAFRAYGFENPTPVEPRNAQAPSISGAGRVGELLTAHDGAWTGFGDQRFSYQWQRNTGSGWRNIYGQTSRTFNPELEDLTTQLRVRVTATNEAGSSTETSPAVGPIAPTTVPYSATATTDLPVQMIDATEGYFAQYAVDQDDVSRFWSDWSVPAGSWLRIDLGSVRTVRRVVLKSGDRDDYDFQSVRVPTEADLQWSQDAVTWTTIHATGTPTVIDYNLPVPVQARYLRVQANSGVSGLENWQIRTFHAFGYETFTLAKPSNTAAPVVSGTAKQGKQLTATIGSWTGGQLSYEMQWQRQNASGSWEDITGATSERYTLTADDVDRRVRFNVRAINDAGQTDQASGATSPVLTARPVNTVQPAVTGIAKHGETLTADTGTWSSEEAVTYTRQWQRQNADGSWHDITAATGVTYTTQTDDDDRRLRVKVTASNSFGPADAFSAATSAVIAQPPVNVTAPSVTGVAKVGEPLTADAGTWTGSNITYTVQWKRCAACATLHTGTTYTPSADDYDQRLLIAVTASTSGGSVTTLSALTAAVQTAAVTQIGPGSISITDGVATVDPGAWTGADVKFNYQWQRCDANGENCKNILSAYQRKYTLVDDDYGKTLRVKYRATNTHLPGGSEALVFTDPCAVPAKTAEPTVKAEAPKPIQQPAVKAPAVVGRPAPGDALTVDPGRWPEGTDVAVQWDRCAAACKAIDNAHEQRYVLRTEDQGHRVRPVVTASLNGQVSRIEMAGVQVSGDMKSSLLRVGPRAILAPAAQQHAKQAALRGCARLQAAARADCRQAVAARYRVTVRWQQNVAGTVRLRVQHADGKKITGMLTVNGKAGANRKALSAADAAKLTRLGYYTVQLFHGTDTAPAHKSRFSVRPSVQLIHAPGRKLSRRLSWWQDREGTVTLRLLRNGKTAATVRVAGQAGQNVRVLPRALIGKLRPGTQYRLSASLTVNDVRSWPSNATLRVHDRQYAVVS